MSGKFLSLISILFFSSFSFSQTFQNHYGTINYEDAFSLSVTNDNGFIVCGSSFGNGAGGKDAMLIKTDSSGLLQWSKLYGGSGDETAIYAKPIPTGGYVLCGETFSTTTNGDAFIARTDANGNLVWWKNYGGVGYDIAYSVKPLSDGSFIVAGLTENGAMTFDYDAFLMRLNANGDSLWTKKYGGPGIDHAVQVIQTSDNGFLFSGKMLSYGSGSSDVWLVKTNANGDTLWTNIIGGPGWDEGMDLIESNGGYVICGGESSAGSGSYDLMLMKTNLNGNLLWAKCYGGANVEDSYHIEEVPSGGYVAAGYTETFGPGNSRGTDSSNAFVVRTDFNGDTMWAMSYGGLLKEECFSIVNTSDNGFAFCGYTESFGDSGQAYIFKTDSTGFSGCNERSAHPDVFNNLGFVQTHQATPFSRGFTVATPSTTVTAPPIFEQIICSNPLTIEEQNKNLSISVFPNPTSGNINLQLNGENKNELKISIYNAEGECVYSAEKIVGNNIEIANANLSDGIYFIRVSSGNEETNLKVVIAR
jgi:hypothetical protein